MSTSRKAILATGMVLAAALPLLILWLLGSTRDATLIEAMGPAHTAVGRLVSGGTQEPLAASAGAKRLAPTIDLAAMLRGVSVVNAMIVDKQARIIAATARSDVGKTAPAGLAPPPDAPPFALWIERPDRVQGLTGVLEKPTISASRSAGPAGSALEGHHILVWMDATAADSRLSRAARLAAGLSAAAGLMMLGLLILMSRGDGNELMTERLARISATAGPAGAPRHRVEIQPAPSRTDWSRQESPSARHEIASTESPLAELKLPVLRANETQPRTRNRGGGIVLVGSTADASLASTASAPGTRPDHTPAPSDGGMLATPARIAAPATPDITTYSSPVEAADDAIELGPLDVCEILETAAVRATPALRQANRSLAVYVSPDVNSLVIGNEPRVRDLVDALIVLATDTVDGEEIVIDAAISGVDELTCEIRFTFGDGCDIAEFAGIAAQRFDAAEANDLLDAVKVEAEHLGGRIALKAAQGKPIQIELTLPFGLVEAGEVGAELGPDALLGGHVLIAVASEVQAAVLARYVCAWGAEAVIASSASEAAGLIANRGNRRRHFSLLITDADNGHSGYASLVQAAREAGPDGKLPGLVVVDLTGDAGSVGQTPDGRPRLTLPVQRGHLIEAILDQFVLPAGPQDAQSSDPAPRGQAPQARPSVGALTPPEPDPARAAVEEPSIHLLVCEPDGALVEGLGSNLQQLGCSFDTAASQEEIIDRFEQVMYDAILIRVDHPSIDAAATAKEIRRLEHVNNLDPVPIIATVAGAAVKDAVRLGGAATEVISITADTDTLADALENTLQPKSARATA